MKSTEHFKSNLLHIIEGLRRLARQIEDDDEAKTHTRQRVLLNNLYDVGKPILRRMGNNCIRTVTVKYSPLRPLIIHRGTEVDDGMLHPPNINDEERVGLGGCGLFVFLTTFF